MLTIIADTREADAAVIESLRVLPEVTVQRELMKLGDYRVNNWIFERKTLVDFAESLIDGRLFSQAHRLTSSERPAAIILEGKGADLCGHQIRREALQGAMVTLSLIFQLPVLRSFSPPETANLLVYAGRQLMRQESRDAVRRGRRPKDARRSQLYLLQGLPGIGVRRAAQLLDHFGSLQSVMDASQTALQRVEGIGPRKSRAIRSFMERSASQAQAKVENHSAR